ncbi:MAG: alcohol dehydrogenase [Planctomyces sp.]|nr:alcohol dehydrogenase [Planctomyces sp.]
MNPWQVNGPRSVRFGAGVRHEVGAYARPLAKRLIVLLGSRTLARQSLWTDWLEGLGQALPVVSDLTLPSREPRVSDVDELARSLRGISAGPDDLVVVVGGGSAIDLVKAACGMATQREVRSCREYLEGVGTGAKLVETPLRWIALPTTAGTGAEATRNAVISSDASCIEDEPPFKKSFRSDELYAAAVFLDPEWTVGLPRETTIHSGLDAITQLIESGISGKRTPYTTMLAGQGLAWGLPAFEQLLKDPHDIDARGQMLSAAYLSGVALANSGLGIAHAVAAALGAELPIAHGRACAVMLPHALDFNREVSGEALAHLAVAAGVARTANDTAVEALRARVVELVARCDIPSRLGALGVTRERIPSLVRLSQGNSLTGNPRPVSPVQLHDWLEGLL